MAFKEEGICHLVCTTSLQASVWGTVCLCGKEAFEHHLRAQPCLPPATPWNEPWTGSQRCAGDIPNPFQQVKLELGTDVDLLSLEGLSMEQVLQSGTPLLASGGQVRLLQVSASFSVSHANVHWCCRFHIANPVSNAEPVQRLP